MGALYVESFDLQELVSDVANTVVPLMEKNGNQFMTQMRKNAAFKSIPVVVLTAMDIGPQEIERLNGGVERILQKSAYSLDELKAEIRSLARGSLHA